MQRFEADGSERRNFTGAFNNIHRHRITDHEDDNQTDNELNKEIDPG